MTGLSAAPLFWLPTLFVGLPVLLFAMAGAERPTRAAAFRSGFMVGFAFAWGYFAVTLNWLGAAFVQEGGEYLLLMPLAIGALAALLALFWGLGTGLAALVPATGWRRMLLLVALIGAAEWARGHLFTGFPFNLLGYALTGTPEMMQLDGVIGPYGLTLLALLLGFSPAALVRGKILPLGLAVLALGAQFGFGTWHLQSTPTTFTETRVRLVQPMILEHASWNTSDPAAILGQLTALSAPGLAGTDLLVWPESVFPFFLGRYPAGISQIGTMLPEGTTLLTGAPREPLNPDGTVIPDNPGYNSVLALTRGGEMVGSYDKVHLVPFGEYLPFQNFWRSLGISQFVPGTNGWAPGTNSRLLTLPGLPPFLALICYEAIFPGDIGPVADARFIVNVTNDAWFDGSMGPGQHAHHAQMRAVETGLPLLRAANSGLTYATDGLGRIVASLPAGEAGKLDLDLPDPVPPPLYARLGDWPFVLALLGFAGIALPSRGRKRNARRVPPLSGT